VLIAEQGKIIYKKSLGYSNFSTKKKLNENTMFLIASLSKSFTAIAILMLVEDDKLQLTDTLTHYFPSIPYKNITIEHLLTHTSGIPDYMKLFDKYWDKSQVASNTDVIDLLSRYHPPILFKPNEQYSYSNTGYALLGSIIEKVSGVSYSKFLSKRIFKPLKMKRTKGRLLSKISSNHVIGYVLNKELDKPVLPGTLKEWDFVTYLNDIVGDGSITSTTLDLLKWDRALYTNKLVSLSTIEQVFTPHKLKDKGISQYGFGWDLEDGDKITGKYAYHTGHWPGNGAYIARFLDQDKIIIVLRNLINYSKRASGLPKVYTDILFNKPFELPTVDRR
jgi:CubicO group peptidase (beta-lactamase class C family)